MKLVSLAQRRNEYKQSSEVSLTRSIEQPFVSTSLSVNRSTMGFQSDLMRLRDIRKAEKFPEDKSREEVLFGELDAFDRARIDRKLTSRNKLVAGRHTYNFNSEVEDIDHIPDDNDSIPEENFDLDINEHDEEILLKSVNIHQMEINSKTRQETKESKPPLILPETGLEVIKETEDVNISPNKINLPESKIKISFSKQTISHESKGSQSHKFGLKTSAQSKESKINRRNTVSLRPPKILNGPKSISHQSKLENQAKVQPKGSKLPISPFAGKRLTGEVKVEAQTSRVEPKLKSSYDTKFGFSHKAKLASTQNNIAVVSSPQKSNKSKSNNSKSKSPD